MKSSVLYATFRLCGLTSQETVQLSPEKAQEDVRNSPQEISLKFPLKTADMCVGAYQVLVKGL
jgi:hypothetical protein